jgi:two-component system chemotaxis response regulator CheY
MAANQFMVDKRMRILVVDDYAPMRQTVKKQLLQLGFDNIAEAAGAGDAVQKIEGGEEFGLIISDWNMPETTGLDFLNYVRGSPQSKGIPFLMITAEASKDNIIQAAKAGVSQYIVKPFTAEILKEKLETVFTKIAGRQQMI